MRRYFVRVGLEHLAFGLIIPIDIMWKLQNGLSISEVALTESAILLTTTLWEIPAGYFADRFSNRLSLIMASISHFLALLITVNASNLSMFMIAALLFGIGWAFTSGADEAHIHDDYSEDKKHFKKNISKLQITDESSTILGMVLSSLIISVNQELSSAVVTSAILMGIVCIYSIIVLPGKSKAQNLGQKQLDIFKTFTENMKKYWLLFICLGIIYEYGRFLWQPQLEATGLEIANFGMYFALLKIFAIIGSYIALKSQFSNKNISLFFVLTLLALLSFLSSSGTILLVGLSVLVLAENYLRVWQSVLLNKIASIRRATFLSSASLSRNLVGAGLILILGLPAENYIGLAIIILIALKSLAGIIIMSKLLRKKQAS
jgi:MFS family permease